LQIVILTAAEETEFCPWS